MRVDELISVNTLHIPVDGAHFRERVERIDDALIRSHPGDILEESKAFLECTFKTIITNKHGKVDEGKGYASFPSLYAQARDCVELSEDVEIASNFSELCEMFSRYVGKMRNSFGSVSHGKDGYSEATVDIEEALFVARIVLSISGLFFSRHIEAPVSYLNKRLAYENYGEFNEFIDETQPSLEVLGISLKPSEVLFRTDLEAYRQALIDFAQGE
jgi:hypothetical protein